MKRSHDYNPLRAAARALVLVVWTIVMFVPVFTFWALRLDRLRARAIQTVYAGAVFFSGVRISVHGKISRDRPLMLVSNHTSYLDIFVLGTLAPLSFTPKKEIRSWPVIGFFCVLADCVFIERRPTEINEAKAQMERRLDRDKVLCLFPEGTTSDGKSTLPFRSGFLSLAEEYAMPVQPATVAYTHIGDEPITDARREEIAWIGEATFFGHLKHFLGLPPVRAEVVMHPNLRFNEFEDRKALTKAAEDIIRQSLVTIRHAG